MHERLYRSRTDRVLFGVAGGFAEWLDLDPALVRLVWALLILAGGAGLLLYIVAALVIPEEPWQPYAAGTPAAGAPVAGQVGDAAGSGDAASPGAGVNAGAGAGAGAGLGQPGAPMSWHESRAARRAARQAARGQRDGSGVLIFGVILVVIGAWFLFKDLVPNLDDRYFGPGLLVLLGLVLVVGAMRRRPG